jgi:hypothetical protein
VPRIMENIKVVTLERTKGFYYNDTSRKVT